jgi:hypothetical protein
MQKITQHNAKHDGGASLGDLRVALAAWAHTLFTCTIPFLAVGRLSSGTQLPGVGTLAKKWLCSSKNKGVVQYTPLQGAAAREQQLPYCCIIMMR